jgi:hypothetical protein
MDSRQIQQEAGVTGSIALGIYDAMEEMVRSRGTRIPSRLDPLIQRALHSTASPGGDPTAKCRLESMSVHLDYLRAAHRARLPEEIEAHTASLAQLTSQWLGQTRAF